jgi:hypothetical protein
MFRTRIRDSPFKKRLSTLEEGSRVKVRGPKMTFLGNPEFWSGIFSITFGSSPKLVIVKGMLLKNQMKEAPKKSSHQ